MSLLSTSNYQSYTNCCLSLQAPASTSMQSTLDGHNPGPGVRPNSVLSSSQELGVLQLGLEEVTREALMLRDRSFDASFVSSLTM